MGRPQSLEQLLPAAQRVLRHFGPAVKRQRPLIAASMAALLLEVVLRLLEPWPLKIVFDQLLGAHPGRHPWATAIAGLPPMTVLLAAVAAVVILGALRAVAAYITSVGFALIGNRVLTDVRQMLYQRLQELSLSFHARAGSGELVVRVVGDVGLLKDVAVTALLPLLANVLVLLGMASVMLWLDVRLGLLALAVLPLFAVSTLRLGRQIHDVARLQREREGSMAARVAESMSGVNTVKSLSLEGAFSGMFARDSARSLREGVRGKRLEAKLERSADLLTALATALVLGYGTYLALRQAITPGDLLVFLSYLKTAFRPVRDFAKYSGRLAKATAAGERVVELLEREPEVTDRQGAVPAPALHGGVRLEGVSFAYEPGHPVLHDVSLEIAPGQRVAVVGPSGSGKSTLVGMLLRLHDPTTGRVLLDGRDVRDYTLASVRAQVTVVLQDALLFRGTVRENISYGVSEATEEQIMDAARVAGADDFIRTLPRGYETVVGERGVMLSAGQRQRIAIARAALRRAALIILDEPTTGLDEENQQHVTQALARFGAGRTTFLVTHDLALAATADWVIHLQRGRIVAQGPPDQRVELQPTRHAPSPAAPASYGPQAPALCAADEALIRREVDLPGLGLVLNPARMRERLASLWPDARVSAVRATYLRYKPRTSCIVSYRVATGGGEIDVHATARARSDADKLAKVRDRTGSRGPSHRVLLEDCAVVVSVFPEDAGLRGLRWLDSPERRQQLRQRLLGGDVSPGVLTRLRYKPERRWVGCLSGGTALPVLLKVYAAPEFENGLLGSLIASSDPGLRFPRRLGMEAAKGVMAQEWIDGPPLGEVLYAGAAGAEETRHTGEALALLHREPPPRMHLRTRLLEPRQLDAAARALESLQPELAERVQKLARDLAVRLAAQPKDLRLVHGDFHSGQVLLADGAPVMIDLDEAGLGDPAADLGSFLAHLEYDEVAGLVSPQQRSVVTEALLEGYARAVSPPAEPVLRLHAAAALFQRSAQFFRDRDPSWPERTLSALDRVERLLRDPSTSRPPSTATPSVGGNGLLEGALDLPAVQRHFRALPDLESRFPGLTVRWARVVRHKPGRRALVEYEVAGKAPLERLLVLGKVRARGADHSTYALCRSLVACGFGPMSEDSISVPEPLGLVPELGMWLQTRVPGTTATALLAGESGPDVAARLADALHKLNRAPVTVSRTHEVADELAILRDRLGRLAYERRDLADRLERLLDACARLAARLDPPVPVIVHRDFYPAQAIVNGDRVYLVDLDLCARGDPALDIGNCLGHLVEQGLREYGDPAMLEGPAQALAQRFASREGPRALTAADIYTTLTLARHVWLSTQIPERRSTTLGLLDLCEQRLGLGGLQTMVTAAARECAS